MSGAAALAEGAVLAPVAGPVVSLVPVAVAVVALAAAARSAPARTPLAPAPDRPRSSPLAALGGAVRRRLGRPADPAADLRVGRIVVLAIGAALVDPLLGVTVAGGGLVLPRWTRRRAAARARRQLVDELPEIIDLLALGAGAGLTVPLAVEVAARRGRGALAEALGAAVRATQVGVTLDDALAAVTLRLGEPVRGVIGALVGSARDGVPLEPALVRLADDARRARRRAAEERARRLPVRLLFPLIGCVLPAFALLTVVPLLAGALGGLAD